MKTKEEMAATEETGAGAAAKEVLPCALFHYGADSSSDMDFFFEMNYIVALCRRSTPPQRMGNRPSKMLWKVYNT